MKNYDTLHVDELLMIQKEESEEREGRMLIMWSAGDEFGELSIEVHKDGRVLIDHENMSKEFCIALMTKLIEKHYI